MSLRSYDSQLEKNYDPNTLPIPYAAFEMGHILVLPS